jgi:hypothetical protein
MKHYGFLDAQGYAIDPADDTGSANERTYDRRWSYYFAGMKKRLLKLKSFRYGIGPWGDVRHFEDDVLDVEVGEKGYIAFDQGLDLTPWIENEMTYMLDNGLEEYGSPTEEFGNDEAAYNKLMDTVKTRR